MHHNMSKTTGMASSGSRPSSCQNWEPGNEAIHPILEPTFSKTKLWYQYINSLREKGGRGGERKRGFILDLHTYGVTGKEMGGGGISVRSEWDCKWVRHAKYWIRSHSRALIVRPDYFAEWDVLGNLNQQGYGHFYWNMVQILRSRQ